MKISFDLGASTIDCVFWKGDRIDKILSFESLKFPKFDLEVFFKKSLKLNSKDVDEVFVTGGRSHFLPKINGLNVKRVGEIEAIGRGGAYIWGNYELRITNYEKKKLLIVSMGTGTCIVSVENNHKIKHIGGTGIGGGTFLGLAKEMLGETSIPKLISMFKKGDRRKVDLSVGEIIGKGIGIVPEDSTASNLGKLVREINFSKSDLAAGIANLIGQTIATAAVFAAKAEGIKTIVLCGKLTRIAKITEIIFEVGKIYNISIVLPKNADYVSAIGAGVTSFSAS